MTNYIKTVKTSYIYREKNVERDQKTMLIYLPPFMFILLSNNNAEYDTNLSYTVEIIIQSKFSF